MDVARCTHDDVLYHVSRFIELSPSDIELKRNLLKCAVCDNVAYYRVPSVKGTGACFGARPHKKGCFAASEAAEKVAASVFNEVDPKSNDGKIIKIKFSSASEKEVNVVDDELGADVGKSAARSHTGSGTGGNAVVQRNLKKILLALVFSPSFAKSDVGIRIDGQLVAAKDLFVNLDDDDTSDEKIGVYWGVILQVKKFSTHAFLDGKSRGINLPSNLFDELLNKFDLKSLSELVGCHIIGVGRKQPNLIKVNSVDRLFVIKKPGE